MIQKLIITTILGALAVIIGAFGAHALDKYMDAYSKSIFETGSRYHFYHVFLMVAIILLAWVPNMEQTRYISYAWNTTLIGILLFSGSLYLLATKELHSIPTKILGPITPIGGFFLILGWLFLMIHLIKSMKINS